MKKIILKQLTLENFKGVKSFGVIFDAEKTNIYGDNGTGKTTLYDAFIWLLFDKNSEDDKQFSIKTLGENNEPIHHLEHIVSATIQVDGRIDILKKRHREKWQTKKGEAIEYYTGNENHYWVNEVPFTQTQYNEYVASICTENIFKSITNTSYFFSLDWKVQRSILLSMIPSMSDIELMKGNIEFTDLAEVLVGKDIEGYEKELKAKIKLLKDELEKMPSGIKELTNSIPEIDYAKEDVERDISEGTNSILEIDKQINSEVARYETESKKQVEISKEILNCQNLQRQMFNKHFSDLKIEYTKDINRKNELLFEIKTHKLSIEKMQSQLNSNIEKVAQLNNENTILRDKFNAIQSEKLTYDESKFSCPTCNRPLEESDIESKKQAMQELFNGNKAKRLAQINKDGVENSSQITTIESISQDLKQKIGVLENQIKELQSTADGINPQIPNDAELSNLTEKYLESDQQYQAIESKLKGLKAIEVFEQKPSENKELKEKKQWLTNEIAELNKKLGAFDIIENTKKRIVELEEKAKSTAQLIADLEKQEFLINRFIKYKMDMVEKPINKMFSIVQFKLFKKNINGGEEPCCIGMVNGVPYPDVNYAGKVQAGLDVIRTMSVMYDIQAPIFIDNRESVTAIPNMNTQIINLIKNKDYKELTIK